MDIAKVERVYTSYSGVYDHIFGKIFHESREACVRNLRIRPEEKFWKSAWGPESPWSTTRRIAKSSASISPQGCWRRPDSASRTIILTMCD